MKLPFTIKQKGQIVSFLKRYLSGGLVTSLSQGCTTIGRISFLVCFQLGWSLKYTASQELENKWEAAATWQHVPNLPAVQSHTNLDAAEKELCSSN